MSSLSNKTTYHAAAAGVDPGSLEYSFRIAQKHGIKTLHLIPHVDNCKGTSVPDEERRAQVEAYAEGAKKYFDTVHAYVYAPDDGKLTRICTVGNPQNTSTPEPAVVATCMDPRMPSKQSLVSAINSLEKYGAKSLTIPLDQRGGYDQDKGEKKRWGPNASNLTAGVKDFMAFVVTLGNFMLLSQIEKNINATRELTKAMTEDIVDLEQHEHGGDAVRSVPLKIPAPILACAEATEPGTDPRTKIQPGDKFPGAPPKSAPEALTR